MHRKRARGEHTDRRAIELVAVTIGAMEDAASPTFGQSRDFRQDIAHANGEKHAPGGVSATVGCFHRKHTLEECRVHRRSVDPLHGGIGFQAASDRSQQSLPGQCRPVSGSHAHGARNDYDAHRRR